MILFMATPNHAKEFKQWLDTNLDNKIRNQLFPRPGEYDIYIVLREFARTPLITEVSDDSPMYLKNGYLTKYVVN